MEYGWGVAFGRRKTLLPEQIAELQARRRDGITIRILMKEYRLSKATIYRYLNQSESL